MEYIMLDLPDRTEPTILTIVEPEEMKDYSFGIVVQAYMFGQYRVRLCRNLPGAPIVQEL